MRLSRRDLLSLGLLWLCGNCLRIGYLAIPPVIPMVRRDLGLQETQVGLLTALPVILLALGAVLGSLLISRIGGRRALILGLVVIAAASGGRGAGPSVPVLFAATFLMGCGVAVVQTALPALVAAWMPRAAGLGTAAYTNGLLVGETLAASLTIPLVLPAMHGSWPLSLAFWALPVVAAAILVAALTRAPAPPPGEVRARWWPDWRDGLIWRLGLIFGFASAFYFAINTFMPEYLVATGRAPLIAATLTAINLGQFPASIALGLLQSRLVGRRGPFQLSGLALVGSAAGLIWAPGAWVVAAAAAAGFSAAVGLVLTLALPPVVARPGEVHRFSAGVLTITYFCAFGGPLLTGAVWDLTGRGGLALGVVALLGVLVLTVSHGLRLPHGAIAAAPAR